MSEDTAHITPTLIVRTIMEECYSLINFSWSENYSSGKVVDRSHLKRLETVLPSCYHVSSCFPNYCKIDRGFVKAFQLEFILNGPQMTRDSGGDYYRLILRLRELHALARITPGDPVARNLQVLKELQAVYVDRGGPYWTMDFLLTEIKEGAEAKNRRRMSTALGAMERLFILLSGAVLPEHRRALDHLTLMEEYL
jgi:hypothetical protein